MPKTSQDPNRATLTELLADPIVQMVMRADHVTEHELAALIGEKLSKLGAGSKSDFGGNPIEPASRDYRPSVGIMLLNEKKEVFVGRRRKTAGEAWQMPQGGIDEGEDPRVAAFRELKEETSIENAEILAESKSWLYYDLPVALVGKTRHKGWRGQRQKWFAMRFKGSDVDIDIATHESEFSAWKWVAMEDLADLIVPFKRLVYMSVLDEFRDAVEPFADRI